MENKKNLRFFVIITNVAFWLMLGFCGLLMALGLPMETISKYAPIVCSWASFLVLMLWAKKILPGTSRKAFIKGLFRDRVRWQTVLLALGIPVAVFTVSAVVMSVVFKVPFGELINTDFTAYPAMFLLNLLAGPMGEEPGWRGYYLIGSTKVRGVLRGTMMTGLFWGLWHFPLWLMDGYSPAMLIAYAASFLTAIISFNVTLSFIYLKYRNLLYCILMHQMFNFLTSLFNFGTDALPGDKAMVVFMVISTICYALVAVITVLINKDKLEVDFILRKRFDEYSYVQVARTIDNDNYDENGKNITEER